MQLPHCLVPRPSNWAGGKQSECTARTSCQSLYTYAHPVCKCSRLSSSLSRSTAATLSAARPSLCPSVCQSVCLSIYVCASSFVGSRPEEIIVIRIDLPWPMSPASIGNDAATQLQRYRRLLLLLLLLAAR